MTDEADEPRGGERIAKVLARVGVASRREVERLIAEGRVTLDGVVLTTPAIKVGPGARITVDGKPVGGAEKTRVWRYHKPAGLVTTHRDPQGRPTVFDRLPPTLPRTISVGRLDLNSEGLLLLTNDGGLARRLELPSNGWRRRYRVRVFGKLTDAEARQLTEGITVEGMRLKAEEAKVDRVQGGNTWMTIVLTEGKNREIRKMVEALGARVNRLMRVAYGPFQLGALKKGEIEEVTGKVLKEQLGVIGSAAIKSEGKRPRGKAKDGDADRGG